MRQEKDEFYSIVIRVPTNDKSSIQEMAKDQNRSVNGMINKLLRNELSRWQKRKNYN